MNSRNCRWAVASTMLLVSHTGLAGPVEGLTTFTAGTPARASEVNGNFSAVKGAVDGSAADIAALQNSIETLQNTVGTLQTQNTSLQGGMTSLQTTVTALQSEVNALKLQGPRGYAVVELRYDATSGIATPVLVSERTKNFDAVRRSGFTPAAYCLTPSATFTIDPATTATVVSADWGLTLATAGEQLFAYVDTTSRECNPGEFMVVTNTLTGAGRSLISFSFIVP